MPHKFSFLSAAFLILTGMAYGGPLPSPYASSFDPPVNGTYSDGYGVIGSFTPPSWSSNGSWGKIELLEGHQAYRTEGYNLRTQKLRFQDTYQDRKYPLRAYYGVLNQQLVDGFNLFYRNACAGSVDAPGAQCPPSKSPQRPEARFVLLHYGPKTASLQCDLTQPPALLVHGAMQTANVWIAPKGNDGAGGTYPGNDSSSKPTGFVQALEAAGRCTYAVTFGNFHGDNFNQAINLANAIDRVKKLTGSPKIDLITWSKGALPADLYLANVSSWNDWGDRYFEGLAAEQARHVPPFRKDVRAYVPLSGPHSGIDLNFRHPYEDLLIVSTQESAPIGQGPVTWGMFSAIQCVNLGFDGLPVPGFQNPYAASVCVNRGGTWPDYWSRVYTSNITGLDGAGKPLYSKSLKTLNVEQGLLPNSFSFDEYNISMWGAIDDNGAYISPYLGQLQASYDLRDYYPTPNRQDDANGWSSVDTDESKWHSWLDFKIDSNPTPFSDGSIEEDAGHTTCRNSAYDPQSIPCFAKVFGYYDPRTAESFSDGYATYRLMDGIGINAVMEMGGNFIERLRQHGLSPDLDFLYVLYGMSAGASGTVFEMDGMSCPSCAPHGDGVLFDVSIAALDQLTQGWSDAAKASKASQEGMPYSHLEMGATPEIWNKVIAKLKSIARDTP